MAGELDTGALGASGRFARMEAALERIEAKLDLKADVTRVLEVERRVQAIDALIGDLTSGKVTTALSQLYLQKFGEMERSIEKLEAEALGREAVVAAVKSSSDNRFRVMAAVLSVLSLIATVMSTISLVHG